jgi:AraC-like DNA-binding protein
MRMVFVQRVPAPPLDAFIRAIWYWRSARRPHALERILPSGAAQLIVNLQEDENRVYDETGVVCSSSRSGVILAGVKSRYQIIDTAVQEHVLGVSFKPGGTVAFFRLPAHETADADIAIESLWTRAECSELRERLLSVPDTHAKLAIMESALLKRCAITKLHPAVTFALNLFERHDVSVTAATESTGLSQKRFIEKFKSTVGLTPKQFCRIQRFQRALSHAQPGRQIDWTRLALDCDYFDQSHFIHDFRAFAGISPTAYAVNRTEFQNHVKFVQSAGDAK